MPSNNARSILEQVLPSSSLDETTMEYLCSIIDDAIDNPESTTKEDLTDTIAPLLNVDANLIEESLAKLFVLLSLKGEDGGKSAALLNAPVTLAAATASAPPPTTTTTPAADITPSTKKSTTSAASTSSGKSKTSVDSYPDLSDEIRVFAQVSRFHREVVSSSESREVFLNDVCIQVCGKDLLSGAKLQLLQGRRYGLVSRNGLGKTTLLTFMATGRLVGFPLHIRCLLVAQEAQPDDRIPVEAVVACDLELLEARRHYEILKKGIEQGPASAKLAAAEVLADKAKKQAKVARDIANMRSRTRGKAARENALAAEAKFEKAQQKVAKLHEDQATSSEEDSDNDDNTNNTDDAAVDATLTRSDSGDATTTPEALLFEVEQNLIEMGSDNAEGRATAILKGLLFTKQMMQTPSKELSGGWRMRLALAQALYMKPDVLCLDEPTNHLDLHAVLWLEHYISTQLSHTAVIIVSHDRGFLDNVATDIIHLRNATLTYHSGNYSDFEHRNADLAAKKQRLFESQERRKEVMKQQVQKMLQNAARTHNDKQLNQAASRKKKLMERSGLDFLEDGTRFKLSYHGGMLKDTKRFEISAEVPDPPIKFTFQTPDNLGTYGAILQLSEVSVGYEPNVPVITDVTLDVDISSRLVLAGKNGHGKSTIMKVLAGEMVPWTGDVLRNKNLRIGYFSQHCIDNLDRDLNCIDVFKAAFPALPVHQCRGSLGSFGIQGRLAEQRVSTLSGGQKARLAFALMAQRNPHILLLDEPSNHLDHDTIDALIEAINDFQGGVMLISHDQRLVGSVVNELYVVKKGRCTPYENSYQDYVAELRASINY